jgi:hypothetical protein
LTLPVIWPVEAALTLLPEYNKPSATTRIAEANATTLYAAFIEFFSSLFMMSIFTEYAN